MEIAGENCNFSRRYLHFGATIGSFFVLVLTILAQLALGSPRVALRQQQNHFETWAWMEIELDAPGRAEARIYLHPTPHDPSVVVREIKQALGCENLESPEVDEEEEVESELAAESGITQYSGWRMESSGQSIRS